VFFFYRRASLFVGEYLLLSFTFIVLFDIFAALGLFRPMLWLSVWLSFVGFSFFLVCVGENVP